MVLVLENQILVYWYWYLHKLHHLYVPVPGKFLQKWMISLSISLGFNI